jgi:hypothetical protein
MRSKGKPEVGGKHLRSAWSLGTAVALSCLLVVIMLASCAKVGPPPGLAGKKDVYPPKLTSLSVPDNTHLVLDFDEVLDGESVRKMENYVITEQADESAGLEVADAMFGRGENEVILSTAPMKPGVKYLLSVYNVRDKVGNPIGRRNQKRFTGIKHKDEEKPSLLRTSPANGQKDVSLSICPLLSFNDVMNADTVAQAVTLLDDAEEPVTGMVVGSGHAYHFIPDHPLLTETVYTLKVSTDATDLAGNQLYEEAEIRFKTVIDANVVSVSGRVLDKTKGQAGDLMIYVTGSALVDDPDAPWHARAPVSSDLTFTLNGISPELPRNGKYYLWVVGTLPAGTPREVTAYGCPGAVDDPQPVEKLQAGSNIEDLEITLAIRDKRGPTVTGLDAQPNPYTAGDGLRAICTAEQTGESEATIKAAEVFVGRKGSDGTGLALVPLHGVVSEGRTLRLGGDFLQAFKGVHEESAKIYFHAQNSDGYWGKMESVSVDRRLKSKAALFLKGEVDFGAEAAENAILRLYAFDGSSEKLVLMGKADKKGKFRLGPLEPSTYHLFAYNDEEDDHIDEDSDPCVYWTDETGSRDLVLAGADREVKLNLGHRPVLQNPMARLYVYAADAQTLAHATLYLSVGASDADYDISDVTVITSQGEHIALHDDGKDGDQRADDGIYSRVMELEAAQIPPVGSVNSYRIQVDDKKGNSVVVGPEDFPSLSVHSLEPPQGLKVEADKEELRINWDESVVAPPGGYLLFILPADRESHFDGPGTGELYTNFPQPYHDLNEVTLSIDQLGNYWSISRGSRMLCILMALANDADAAGSDKAIAKFYFTKP